MHHVTMLIHIFTPGKDAELTMNLENADSKHICNGGLLLLNSSISLITFDQ